MKFAAALFAFFVGSVPVGAVATVTAPAPEQADASSLSPLLRGKVRGLTAPDPNGAEIDHCILVNLKTMAEYILDPESVTRYNYIEASTSGWSVKCLAETGKNVDYVKFFYNGEVSTQYYSPERFETPSDQLFWMRGDNRGKQVSPVPYLNSRGEKKFTVKFYTWEGGDQYPSDEKYYVVNGGGSVPDKCSGVLCPFGAVCDQATGACNCKPGFVLKNGACVPPSKCDGVTCPTNATCQEATGSCQCNAGLVLKNGACVPPSKCAGVTCPTNATCQEATGACQCNAGLVLKNGACVPPSKCDGVTCPANATCEEVTGTCQCNAGLVLKNGVCVPRPKCDGVTCTVNEVCQEATGTCICKPGFEIKFGVCYPIDRCGGVNCNHIHGGACDPLTGTCGCRPKFFLEHGVVCLPICNRVQCPQGSYCSHQTGDCICHQPNQELINGVCRCPLSKSGIFGTPVGTPFDHSNGITGCPQVNQVKLQADTNLIRVGVLVLHPYGWLEDGGFGGIPQVLSHFAHGEYISQVVACKDAKALSYLKISTSKGRAIEGGINTGDCEIFTAPGARAIVGFFGTYTQYIHSLGVVYGPVPSPV